MSSMQEGIEALAREPTNKPIIAKFFRFAAALAILPVIFYFLVYNLVRFLNLNQSGILSAPILGGLAAILTINIVTSLFALLALRERSHSEPGASNKTESESSEKTDTEEREEGKHRKKSE
ncbi:hypothetical protein BWQ96_06614 [Gracilariopsis chorda]|uniref:Vacuolar ATPase assembly integral membrane protein VMA21 homolog n=1 Tax=Gracilariopsis chorda TaxID=448386 RepID=A0A2V3INE7_9FLOR|nr:hypothetical protein BWQ96_06614 [Gracilariopsis chorda]|eukprot:PXF43605.1 hypothetical protein BWQ96_06614 [Gracilariopsis chorda]